MTDKKSFSLLKPTKDTPFHIDFDWWKENDNNWHVYLKSYLCEEHKQQFEDMDQSGMIDWIDPRHRRGAASGWNPTYPYFSLRQAARVYHAANLPGKRSLPPLPCQRQCAVDAARNC